MGDNVKRLTEVEINSIRCSPFIHQGSHLIVEGHQVRQVWSPFHTNMLTAPSHLFVLHICLEMVSRIIHSTTFPRIKVKLTDLWFPGSSFLTFLNIEVTFSFFPSLGMSPHMNLHSFLGYKILGGTGGVKKICEIFFSSLMTVILYKHFHGYLPNF